MSRPPITKAGSERLRAELEKLKFVDRPRIIAAIAEARAHGDLKENAEYHAAKEKQGIVSARVGALEARIKELSMYTTSSIARDVIGYGSLVELEDLDSGETVRYEMVFAEEVDAAAGRVSLTSPVGQALLKRSEGDEVTIQLPNARRRFEIVSVTTIHDRPSE